ncbi:MAG: glycosyltransferase, partial [Bacteroidales bacterium]|nr:glycosyltransferase [Bacteroidales bacterium]
MKVVSINTSSDSGGAAIAALRIAEAINKYTPCQVTMLVRDGKTSANVISTTHSVFKSYLNFARFAFERFLFYLCERSPEVRFLFSIANTGEDLSNHPLVRNADLIHLHWVNGGFLSLPGIEKILRLGKPVVWTLHDMWLFTGGCHHSGDCRNYQYQCGNCLFLRSPSINDLSHRVWEKKDKIFSKNYPLTVVTCSRWLMGRAKESSLLKEKPVFSIPNPIDIETFKPLDKNKSREKLGLATNKKYLLFAAANVNNYFKGFTYFAEATKYLASTYPQLLDTIEILVAGRVKDSKIFEQLSLPYRLLGNVQANTMIDIYNASDLYVTSSLQENLPNTIMESMACGVP